MLMGTFVFLTAISITSIISSSDKNGMKPFFGGGSRKGKFGVVFIPARALTVRPASVVVY